MRRETLARRRLKEPMEVEITSLLDILVILLAFLLSVYSSSDLDLNLVENLTLPTSESSLMGRKAVEVQVDRNKRIWVGGKEIGGRPREWRGKKIKVLFKELQREKKRRGDLRRKIAGESKVKKNDKRINIVLDQGLPYEVLHKVMHTSALAGFTEFKFVVRGLH